jgi:hypothetical protein
MYQEGRAAERVDRAHAKAIVVSALDWGAGLSRTVKGQYQHLNIGPTLEWTDWTVASMT